MSLLNDMLRDLSRSPEMPAQDTAQITIGKDEDHHRAQEQRKLFAQSSVAKPLRPRVLPSILVFIVVLSGFWAGQHFLNEKSSPSTTVSESTNENTPVMVESINVPASFIAPSELDERLVALEPAITALTDVVANAHQVTEEIHRVVDSVEPEGIAGAIHDKTESVSIKEPFADMDVNYAETVNIESVDDMATESVEPALYISPNPAWQDHQFALQTREMLQTGQVEQSISRLQTFISSHSAAEQSTRLLLDVFCEQENSVAAQRVLTQATFLSAATNAYYTAKIALLDGDLDGAVALLESSLAEAEDDERYRALLASVYQRSGMNEEAASHYRRLLSVFGEKPAYWLGFALAQDALQQSQLALQAYQRVSQYSDLQPPVRQYIEQRLLVLQQ